MVSILRQDDLNGHLQLNERLYGAVDCPKAADGDSFTQVRTANGLTAQVLLTDLLGNWGWARDLGGLALTAGQSDERVFPLYRSSTGDFKGINALVSLLRPADRPKAG